jgi:hypothetical protein
MVPALELLHLAVMAGEDESARHILERLLARRPQGAALELARAYERILDGRALVAALDLRLEAEEVPESPGAYEVFLLASQGTGEPVTLRPRGARLRETVVAVDPDGAENRRVGVAVVEDLGEVVLPAGELVRRHLARVSLGAPAGALAVRARWYLELSTVDAVVADRALPTAAVRVGVTERVRLAAFLSPTPVEPAELLRYLREEQINPQALMERAVRILPERRAEALDLLTPMAEEMSVLTLAQLVAPLRWLAGTTIPGGDAEAWRRWLAARARRAGPAQEAGALALPAPPR